MFEKLDAPYRAAVQAMQVVASPQEYAAYVAKVQQSPRWGNETGMRRHVKASAFGKKTIPFEEAVAQRLPAGSHGRTSLEDALLDLQDDVIRRTGTDAETLSLAKALSAMDGVVSGFAQQSTTWARLMAREIAEAFYDVRDGKPVGRGR